MQQHRRWQWPATVVACLAMIAATMLAGLFIAGPMVAPLGAAEGHGQAMEHAKMQPGMAEAKAPPVEHPMMNPGKYTERMKCPNCGMMLNMWARTRHLFTLGGKEVETCSLHCLADRAMREGAEPADVKVALYLEPEKMVPADQVFYVLGSSAPGTMTTVSKLAFGDKAAAEKFAAAYGGTVADFAAAYQQSVADMTKDHTGIDMRRKKSGKIVEPVVGDQCAVCGMKPAMYPQNRAQVLTADKKTLHFCSGKCLFTFLADPAQYAGAEVKLASVWATVFPEGIYDYAGGLFYVVDSKAQGPMGPEPFAFRNKKQAEEFAAKEGGTIKTFEELKPAAAGH